MILLPFDVVVVPVETMMLFYFALMGLAAIIVLELVGYLYLRYGRMGPLGKAELGNKRGEIGIIRQQRGKGYVVRLKENIKGILTGSDRHLWATAPETGTDIHNGPRIYMIDAESGQAAPPQVALIADALNEGKFEGIKSKNVVQLTLEFAEKFYYPSFRYSWSTQSLTTEECSKFAAQDPGAYDTWTQRRIADIKGNLAFEIRKQNELSYMAEIRRGVRRTITTFTGFEGDDPGKVKMVGLKSVQAETELSDIEKNDWCITMIHEAAQAQGIAVPISAIANWNVTTPQQTILEDSNLVTEQEAIRKAGSAKASSVIIIVFVVLAGILGFLVGFMV